MAADAFFTRLLQPQTDQPMLKRLAEFKDYTPKYTRTRWATPLSPKIGYLPLRHKLAQGRVADETTAQYNLRLLLIGLEIFDRLPPSSSSSVASSSPATSPALPSVLLYQTTDATAHRPLIDAVFCEQTWGDTERYMNRLRLMDRPPSVSHSALGKRPRPMNNNKPPRNTFKRLRGESRLVTETTAPLPTPAKYEKAADTKRRPDLPECLKDVGELEDDEED